MLSPPGKSGERFPTEAEEELTAAGAPHFVLLSEPHFLLAAVFQGVNIYTDIFYELNAVGNI